MYYYATRTKHSTNDIEWGNFPAYHDNNMGFYILKYVQFPVPLFPERNNILYKNRENIIQLPFSINARQ